jgi:Tfp pilus assembly protein PilV
MKIVLKCTIYGQALRNRLAGKSSRPRPESRAKIASQSGFTLVEAVIGACIVALVFGGIIQAYLLSGRRLQWSGYSLAAQALALQTIEQARATVWDPAQTPPVNEITNLNLLGTSISTYSNTFTFTGYSTNILDIPYSGTNYVMATNYVTILMTNFPGNANVQEQVVTVQTVWPYYIGADNINQYFTNTVSTIISPDNRAPSTF